MKATDFANYPNITNAREWDKVPGKERIYLDTAKQNGGKSWNGGVGYSTCYIDINSRTLIARGEAGARTRKALAPVFEQIAREHDLTIEVS